MQAQGTSPLLVSACAASLACTVPAAAHPDDAQAASATVNGWTIRDHSGHCSAQTRQGGNLFAEIVHHAGSNDTTLLLRGDSWSGTSERRGDAAILRFSSGRIYEGAMRAGRRTAAGDERVTTVSASSDRTLLEDFARAHRVDVSIGGAPAGTLSLRGTSLVAERLRSCAAASFRRHPPPHVVPLPLQPPRTGATPPVYRSGSASDLDYPASALRRREQGTVTMRLDVSEDGRVTRCTITGSSGSPALDSTSCSLAVRRSRYTPARDASGNNVPGTATQTIRWSLPGRAPAPQAPIPPK